MVDPLKATKGRRMSKKTRKKSVKASSSRAARAESTRSAKTQAAKTRGATADTSGKKANKQPARAIPKATALRTVAAPKAAAAKRGAGTRSASRPSPGKTGVSIGGKQALVEGAEAPAFRLPRDGGGSVSLADFAGRKLVLFFYPRADTPGCTREAIDFTRLASAFAHGQTAILGVSADPPKAQEAFRDKHQLSIPLVSDEKHEMLVAYGVWGEKSMYGKTFQGILRTTVLIGADGRIARIWRNVKVDGHADDVLAAARTL
jgi:thioredoxin-dependent peroxiredoxin